MLFAQLDTPNQLRLMKLDLRDKSVAPLHPNETRSEFEPAVSPDGRRLIAVCERDGRHDLYLLEVPEK